MITADIHIRLGDDACVHFYSESYRTRRYGVKRKCVVKLYYSPNLYDILEELKYGSSPQEVRQAAVQLIVDVFEVEDDDDATV